MPDRFEICHAITAKWEGGWSDHPADPGGKTMYGITESRWHEYCDKMKMKRTPVRNVTKAQALKFYRSEFWEACGAPKLFPGVDLAVHDASVNCGVSRGRKWLAASVGSNDHSETVKRICRARLSHHQSLKELWKVFGKGWMRRIADIEVRGVAMSLAKMGATAIQIKTVARAEAESATKSAASTQKKAATTAGGAAASGGAPVVDPASFDATSAWVLGILAVVLVAVVVVLVIRSRVESERAKAYAEVAA